MTLTEILKANGLDEATVKAITEAMKENKIFTASEENLDIRYGKLKEQHSTVTKELEELKKANGNTEDIQKKVSEYEAKISQLEADLKQTKVDSAVQIALLGEKAIDIDYLSYKLKNCGELELDENGKLKGWEDKISSLKTQFPNQFEGSGKKEFKENKLPDGSNGGSGEDAKSLADALRMHYESTT